MRMGLIQYINYRLKQIEDVVNKHIANDYDAHTKETTDSQIVHNEDIGVSMHESSQDTSVKATTSEEHHHVKCRHLESDCNHRFVTDAELYEFKNKVSPEALQEAIEFAEKKHRAYVDSRFANLLNSESLMKSINNLRILANKKEPSTQEFLDTVSSLVSEDELNSHASNGLHITAEDRTNLEMLRRFISNDGVDWDNDSYGFLSISNKPTALPADGGNADTIGGYRVDQIINMQPQEHIYVCSKTKNAIGYPVLEDGSEVSIDNDCLTTLKNGLYENVGIILTSYDTLEGVGTSTILDNAKITIRSESELRNLVTKNSSINLNAEDSAISNCKFENCTINLYKAIRCRIRNCSFKNCTFIVSNMNACMFSENYFIGCKVPMSLGANNIYSSNIEQ